MQGGSIRNHVMPVELMYIADGKGRYKRKGGRMEGIIREEKEETNVKQQRKKIENKGSVKLSRNNYELF